ncbi:cell division protein FtsQ/DivIB [Flavobacterium silvaticum]|uniref:Cell division protein FtsQ n=1 Tax=Flavobacterium silvaticum TaxID=1852020 RepID=A0A972FQI6_9FLAO|nr:cell division protein FtsQ [Flavobacterium silvaticum]NMH27529.1 cell division protein FtsQ [Flavobacterium silvaticum]
MKIFNWINIRLLLVFGLAIFLYAFSSERNAHRKIKKAEVVFDNPSELFISPESVNKLLIEKNSPSGTVAKENLDLNKLEKAVNAHEMVEKSQIFVSVDGVLRAMVKQKTPVVRVFDETGSFYVDYEGKKMPLSTLHTARVPLVTGDLMAKDSAALHEVFRSVHDDDFLKKNIVGIKVNPSGSLEMSNRNFDYVIDFGKPINIERKFRNYKAFFQKAAQDSTIKKYKKINLRFTQQVVCTK